MRRFHPTPTLPPRRETRSRPPCARCFFHPWRRNRTGTPSPARAAKRSTRARSREFSLSCDDAQPFHFPVKPNTVNDQRDGGGKGHDQAGKINRRAFHEIDPNAPASNSERKQG